MRDTPLIAREDSLDPAEFRALLVASTLGERRPVDEPDRIAAMAENADLIVTARDAAGGQLIGVARSVTDFAYCCYVSDLAVDRGRQRGGIGRALLEETRRHLHPRATVILLSAPKAVDYYPKVGFQRHDAAFVLPGGRDR